MDVMVIVNLTPHQICLRGSEGTVIIEPEDFPARVVSSEQGEKIGAAYGVDLYTPSTWGEVENLPDPEEGVIYVVSSLVASRLSREDVYSPGTSYNDGAVRENGQVVAVTRLIRSC
jgi:hypothetical protein